MKKTLISVFAITSLVAISFVALKCRLKPPKKEVFNFDEPIKKEKQDVLAENKKLKYDTQNKIENIPLIDELINGLDFFEEDKRIVCFLFENKVALENIGIFYDPKPKFN